jgi:predicted O-methyltransferase YrrM
VIESSVLSRLMPFHCFLDPEAELRDLLAAFAATRARAFLEIGTHKGFTSAAIALAFPDARVVTIDLPDPLRTRWNPLPRSLVGEAHRALGVAHRIEQVFMSSAELGRLVDAGEIFDLVFIDGDHSADAVFNDLTLSADLLNRDGGVIVAHDYTSPDETARPGWTLGVQEAVDRFVALHSFRKRRLAGLLVALDRD